MTTINSVVPTQVGLIGSSAVADQYSVLQFNSETGLASAFHAKISETFKEAPFSMTDLLQCALDVGVLKLVNNAKLDVSNQTLILADDNAYGTNTLILPKVTASLADFNSSQIVDFFLKALARMFTSRFKMNKLVDVIVADVKVLPKEITE